MCIACDEILSFLLELNEREPLTGNKSTTPIKLVHLSYPQLFFLRPFQLLLCWGYLYELYGESTHRKQGGFSRASVVTYAIRSLTTLGHLFCRFENSCKEMEALMVTKLTVSFWIKYRVRELIMNEIRLYKDALYKIGAKKAMASSDKRLDRLL